MHELSIAMSMVEVAAEELVRQGGGRVHALHLKLGPLSGVIRQALLAAYELACEGSPLEGSILIIQDVGIEVDCPTCQRRQRVASAQDISCPVCGTPTANIVHGRELEIVAMEILDPELVPG